MVSGYLKFIGINVQQHRGIQSFARVDPKGSRTRWFLTIRRSKYHVPIPKDLWHIENHQTLIPWGFAIHEGFSRMAVLLNCSTNNKLGTVLN